MSSAVVDTNVLITFLEKGSRVADVLGRFDKLLTLSFDQAVEDLTIYCKRMGGTLA